MDPTYQDARETDKPPLLQDSVGTRREAAMVIKRKNTFLKKSYQNYKLKKSYQITRCKFRLVDRSSK